MLRRVIGLALTAAALTMAAACGTGTGEHTLTVYSGRSEELIGSHVERFERQTGIEVQVRYGDTAELAAAILEEGDNSPADVFFAQDAGALGALARADRFDGLPQSALDRVQDRFRSTQGLWVGVTGRARVLVYNTERVQGGELPESVLDLTSPEWRGRIGWAPTNGSFQSFVTALRAVEGEDRARAWLEAMVQNDAQTYEGNSPIVHAVAAGEIDAGLVNHYYLLQMGSQDASVRANAANHFFTGGDAGSLVNVAGVGILGSAGNAEAARRFVDFLLSREAGEYFADEVFEYPLVAGIAQDAALPPLTDIEQPDLDLSDLEDLEGTLRLLRDTGVL